MSKSNNCCICLPVEIGICVNIRSRGGARPRGGQESIELQNEFNELENFPTNNESVQPIATLQEILLKQHAILEGLASGGRAQKKKTLSDDEDGSIDDQRLDEKDEHQQQQQQQQQPGGHSSKYRKQDIQDDHAPRDSRYNEHSSSKRTSDRHDDYEIRGKSEKSDRRNTGMSKMMPDKEVYDNSNAKLRRLKGGTENEM